MRVMPERVDLGRGGNTTVGMAMCQIDDFKSKKVTYPIGTRTAMGYQLPKWQRPLVWSTSKKVSLMESLWRGIPCGTWTFNRIYGNPELDDLLIDGQQRLNAIECYLNDEFEVFGYRWSQVTVVDTRFFDSIVFPSYITQTDDEQYLKNYYNMMNFGGVSHTEDHRA